MEPNVVQVVSMPNHFAYIALFSWPLVVYVLFRKLPRADALIWSIVAGYLLLPYGLAVKIKMIPALDKNLIPAASAAVMLAVVVDRAVARSRSAGRMQHMSARKKNEAVPKVADNATEAVLTHSPYARRRNLYTTASEAEPTLIPAQSSSTWIINLLLVVLFITPFITALTNEEPVQIGTKTLLPALHLYDALSMLSGTIVSILPFLLAKRYLAHPDHHALLLRIICISGLIYTLPTLYEVRMSPQIAIMTYGQLSQGFAMAFRDGGWRPVVFMQNGLWLAVFIAMTALSAFALWNNERARGSKTRWVFAGLYLAVVLFLCHSVGALGEFLFVGPIALLLSTRGQLIFASVVSTILLTYPVLRGADLVPVNTVVSWVQENVGPLRAQSLDFRFQNEDILLTKARQKPIAGWGGWGRSRVFNSEGRDISVTDGMWIIVIGVSGWLGYIATFGLLGVPTFLLTLRRRSFTPSYATSGLALVLTANLIDMIPNATLTPVTWLIAGALAGRCGLMPTPAKKPYNYVSKGHA